MALVVNASAYVAEIIRSGIQAVDAGQTEAAKSLGMSGFHTMTRVILPQAVKNILPALGNEFIVMIKEASMASVFFITEIIQCLQDGTVCDIYHDTGTDDLRRIISAVDNGIVLPGETGREEAARQ